jgi:hypothetical protein
MLIRHNARALPASQLSHLATSPWNAKTSLWNNNYQYPHPQTHLSHARLQEPMMMELDDEEMCV